MLRRFLLLVMLLFAAVGLLARQGIEAQADMPQPGDPPLLARISVSVPADGSVSIEGSSGAVFSNAFLAIRNLYTGETVYTRAGSSGSFSADIGASENTPFWISPSASEIPLSAQNLPGILPGGPGVIVYGTRAETPDALPITQISIDGDLSDWDTYPDAARFSTATRTAYAVRNNQSFYLAFSGTYVTTAYSRVEIRFTVDITTYTVTLNPRQPQAAALARINPVAADLGTLIVAARQGTGLELRIPLSIATRPERVRIDAVRWLNTSGGEISSDSIDAEILLLDETDGLFQSTGVISFALDSTEAWSARGAADTLALEPGDLWQLGMNVDYAVTDLPAETRFVGQIALQPVAVSGEDGVVRVVSGIASNNGWSSVLTPNGLPVDNLRSDLPLGEATAEPYQLVRDDDSILIPFNFATNLPDDLPAGLYVPLFSGYTLAADGTKVAWAQADTPPARLPLILNVGGVEKTRLLWTLFADDPSNGSRGVLPAEDAEYAALSNRVRFNSPTYILPPFAPSTRDPLDYPFEPYLLNQLPNSNSQFSAPLIPFQFPAGELSVRITRPDGTVSDLGSTPIVQNQLASSPADERLRFGRQSPLNEYRLATLNPPFTARSFDQYGTYTIELSGTLEDTWGNAYEGGGTYTILSAELLDLTPGVMTGTPFVVGDALNFGLHLAPGFPAEVTVTVRVYPLNGSDPIEQIVSGSANAHGYFQPDEAPFMFETPGEYVIEYEARYTDAAGRLWAASTRGAGVIAEADASLIAHGERGLPGVANDLRPAWFSLPEYASITRISADDATLSLPYHSGDVIRLPDGAENLLQPAIRVQDLGGTYANWLLNTLPDANEGMPLRQLASEGELPVLTLNDGANTSYFTAARPNVTVRQFVSGGDDGGLTLGWDNDDPLNQQPGAGIDGSRPNDFIFLFGGAVVRVPNADADPIRSSAIYAALAVVGEDTPPRVFPPDRGAAGGADGGSLLTVNGQDYDAFINLTGVQPGDVLAVGDTVTVAGQVAPTIGAQVITTYTAPSGEIQTFTGRANPVGMYYDPSAQFAVDQSGIWTVEVRVVLDGLTSAGQIEPPYPQGGVLGTPDGRFSFSVLPRASEALPWNALLKNTIIPTVSPYNFSFTLPEDWTGIEAYYTLTTPGYVIEDEALRMNGRTFSYSYNAPQQSRTFPNLENDGSSGAFRADIRTLTFTATGIDSSGTRQIRSRTFTLMHDHLITTE